ncbi:hypothetical protein [Microbacterium sp. p3-SID336]|uniref:hypothetical protein n=1 Tax=Microbacterium sp. p3-SID336 TaxID=2916212 RepID=UPI0021A28948|nr:hypothetical protein [Microbacterium sp. p3-SID336]MCT1479971.1 hypothetical protein [Microbacterium sp. p3-SID336]
MTEALPSRPADHSPARQGGHRLPPVLSSDAHEPPKARTTTARRRRPPARVLVGVLGGVAVIAGLAVAQVSANLGYDAAQARVDAALRTYDAQRGEVDHRYAALLESTDAGHVILDTGYAALPVPEDAWAALTTAVADGEGIGAEVEKVTALAPPAAQDKPAWFWELFGATSDREADEERVDDLVDDLKAASTDAAEGRSAVIDSGVAVVATAGADAAAFEAAHPSARNDAVIALRDAAADAAAVTVVDDTTATAYVALQAAATQVLTTEAAELAEKAGPLQRARLEVEAFARSLAPGVLLEFDWAPTVNGAGANGSMGGYTTWWWDQPGRAIIQLSDSVAQQWPAERSRALVAHEVGHAISVKCVGMYDSSTQDSIEKWATAWAISMGFTDDANGVWAYGYPPQNYIDAAAGCR